MFNEKLEYSIQELVNLIQSQNFEGTDEEIKIQQVLYFDKYVKDNIDYGFEAVNFSLNNPGQKNPYDSSFRVNGFFEGNELDGRRLAVCGSISEVANLVFKRLGIKCDYVWGHFNIGSEQPKYIGHRWNVLNIGGINYMVDFTAGLIIHDFEKNDEYASIASQLLGALSSNDEYKYLFFDELSKNESIGGFKINEEGIHIDDKDPDTNLLNNSTNNPYTDNPYYDYNKLGTISLENLLQYFPNEQRHVL